jgi:hypothetical protein
MKLLIFSANFEFFCERLVVVGFYRVGLFFSFAESSDSRTEVDPLPELGGRLAGDSGIVK